jgi:hypothetical protein
MTSHEVPKQLTRAENAAYVIETLRKLGFALNPSSRLMRMHRVLQQGKTEFGTRDFWIALESDRDMVQLGFALRELQADGGNLAFRNVVERLLNDSVLPQHDRKDSAGRDAQFELYLAAVCQKAKLLPVGYDEPDVTCFIDGEPFCIAAKRIKSVKQASKRIKVAAGQISNGTRPGIIALDMTIGFNRGNHPVVSPLHNQMLDLINETQARQFIDEREDMIERVGGGKGVLAVVAFDFRTRLLDGAWRQHRSTIWLELQNSDKERRIFQTFYDRFVAVVPNVE